MTTPVRATASAAPAVSATGGAAVPGPGTWKRDAAHFPHRCSPIASRLYETAFSEGFAEGCERYGLPLRTLVYRSVDGWMYNQPHPLGAPFGAPPPPAFVLWLVSRLHPAYRGRRAAAGRHSDLLAEDVRRWEETTKPARIEAHRALLGENLDVLSDEELLGHVKRCLAVHERSVRTHGRLTVAANIGVGLFVNHCMKSMGVSPDDVLRLLHGDSPVSTGDESSLRELLTHLDNATVRRLRDQSTPPSEVLTELAIAPGPAGPAVTAWLDVVGQRALDVYDVLQPRAIELPALLVDRLRAAVSGDAAPPPSSLEILRRRSPDAVTFDRLLRDARASLSLRDERVLYNDYWSSGVTRRALLAFGHRLVERGILSSAHHTLVATTDELESVGPEVAERLARRWDGWYDVREPAQLLGRPDAGDPPVAPFAEPHRTLLEATLLCLQLNFEERERAEDGALRGFGAAVGTIEGPARIVRSPEQFTQVQAGDVVIAPSTSPAWNVILPLMSGLVTDRGGLLCHAAIVAREFGIPAVVGTRDATTRVPDGARVHVDGTTGEVRILSGA